MKHFIILILLWIQNSCIAQDFSFKWQIWPFSSTPYTVTIRQNSSVRQIIIKQTLSSDSIIKQMEKFDCDSLMILLKTLKFRIQDNTEGKVINEYYQTKTFEDTNRLILGRDTIRKGLLRRLGYYFDTDSNKYYRELKSGVFWTDGNIYEGEFMKLDTIKKYSVYCAFISLDEYKINNFIYQLMTKYDNNNSHLVLRQIIYGDKPREKNN
jgi:hypothetical protein